MTVSDYATYETLKANAELVQTSFVNGSSIFAATALGSNYGTTHPTSGTPSTAATYDNTSTFLRIRPELSGARASLGVTRRIATLSAASGQAGNHGTPGTVWLVDLLAASGGLSGIVTGAQTTNLPTATLTRNTDGIGVRMAVVVLSQIGGTAVGCTVSYDNENGSTKTSPTFVIGGTGRRENAAWIDVPITDGDLGVTKVNNINLVSTTGTAGNIGVFLYKPIDCIPNNFYGGRGLAFEWDAFKGGGGLCPVWPETGCVIVKQSQSSSSNYTSLSLRLIEDDV
jgi:hypothetical protein